MAPQVAHFCNQTFCTQTPSVFFVGCSVIFTSIRTRLLIVFLKSVFSLEYCYLLNPSLLRNTLKFQLLQRMCLVFLTFLSVFALYVFRSYDQMCIFNFLQSHCWVQCFMLTQLPFCVKWCFACFKYIIIVIQTYFCLHIFAFRALLRCNFHAIKFTQCKCSTNFSKFLARCAAIVKTKLEEHVEGSVGEASNFG